MMKAHKREVVMPEPDINESIKLKLAVAMSTIKSVEEGQDQYGDWLDVIGICKLTHEVVRRRVFDDGSVLQNIGPEWVPLDMRGKAEFNAIVGSARHG